jgi:hypothetical protein
MAMAISSGEAALQYRQIKEMVGDDGLEPPTFSV